MGTPDFAVPILKTLIETTEVLLVVTKPDAYVGRKKELTASPVKKLAISSNIPVFAPHNVKSEYEEILKYQPDLIVTCAYGQIIPKVLLDLPSLGCINVHASLLPKYRGGAPIHHALINGDDKTGITIMYMDEGMDSGDIISQSTIPIDDKDNVETLHDKLSLLGANLLKEVLPSIIEKTNNRIKQDLSKVTYAKIIKREDEHLDFNTNALNVSNKVRGLNSWPLAYILLDGEELKVIDGYIGESTHELPGTITKILKDALGIACLDKIYYITKLKPFGKKAMLTKDYLNGLDKNKLLNKEVK